MLPASLLTAVEQHGCFSGCYSDRSSASVCVDPARPVRRMLEVECTDCLTFHLGALSDLLPVNMSPSHLARMLSEHMRILRGYQWAVGGYHYNQSGMWLSAVYFGHGVFLARGSVSSNKMSDLESLVEGFRRKIATATDPRMFNLKLYRTQQVYVDMAPPITPVKSAQDLLSSPQCSQTQKPGLRAATLIEYLPLVNNSGAAPVAGAGAAAQAAATVGAATSTPAAAAATASQPRPPLRLGERCPRCGALVAERPSLISTFIGCLC